MSNVKHPSHYQSGDPQGESTVYETIKVIEAWRLGFHLGNTVKYISRAGRKHGNVLEDLKKAKWYLDRFIGLCEKESAATLDESKPAPKI
jgi:hypothetical protein